MRFVPSLISIGRIVLHRTLYAYVHVSHHRTPLTGSREGECMYAYSSASKHIPPGLDPHSYEPLVSGRPSRGGPDPGDSARARASIRQSRRASARKHSCVFVAVRDETRLDTPGTQRCIGGKWPGMANERGDACRHEARQTRRQEDKKTRRQEDKTQDEPGLASSVHTAVRHSALRVAETKGRAICTKAGPQKGLFNQAGGMARPASRRLAKSAPRLWGFRVQASGRRRRTNSFVLLAGPYERGRRRCLLSRHPQLQQLPALLRCSSQYNWRCICPPRHPLSAPKAISRPPPAAAGVALSHCSGPVFFVSFSFSLVSSRFFSFLLVSFSFLSRLITSQSTNARPVVSICKATPG